MSTTPISPRAGLGTGLLLALAACTSPPAEAVPDPADLVEQSRAFERATDSAVSNGDMAGYLANVRAAWELRPHHPILLYHVARALVLNDSLEAGLQALRRLAAMGMASRAERDSGFAAVWDLDEFASLRDQFAANGAPTEASTVAFTLTGERAFLPEGVAYEPRARAYFVGSVHQQKIVRFADGRAAPFAPDADLWSVMGMAVDTTRGILWVATSAIREGRATDSTAVGRAAVAALDLGDGTRRGWYPTPQDGDVHWLGDVTLAPNGDLYATDSRTPAVYRIRRGADTLEAVALQGRLLSPQGLAVSENGETLYVADYALGIVAIELSTGALVVLSYPEEATLLGIDGLYRSGTLLLGIQNGVRPHRIVAMALAPDAARLDRVTVLDANHPAWAEPTLGVVHDGALYYVGNSEWGRFPDDANAASDPRVFRVPLPVW